MKVAIFSSREIGENIVAEDEINRWIDAEGLCAADIMKVCQSESVDADTNRVNLTISIWYIPRPAEQVWHKSEIPTFEEVMNQCPHCGEKITE